MSATERPKVWVYRIWDNQGSLIAMDHSVVVRVQMLAELEEIIDYKKNNDQPERQALIRKTWMKR